MAMNMAWTEVTLVAGAGSGSWYHPAYATARGSGVGTLDAVALDFAPVKIDLDLVTSGAQALGIKYNIQATTTGVSIGSTHPSDTSTVRIWATCRIPPSQYQVA